MFETEKNDKNRQEGVDLIAPPYIISYLAYSVKKQRKNW